MFRQRPDGLDNVVCDSQVMILDGLSIKRITFIGFCTWGYFKENFELKCVDETVEYAKAYFSDIAWPLEKGSECCFATEKALYTDGCKYFTEVKMKDGTGVGYLYYYTTEFSEEKKVKKIIFPQNCSMHIFAITIDK